MLSTKGHCVTEYTKYSCCNQLPTACIILSDENLWGAILAFFDGVNFNKINFDGQMLQAITE